MTRHIHEDEREDARIERAMERDIHPALRSQPEPEASRCRACRERHPLHDLTDDLLCKLCNEAVEEAEVRG